MAQVQRYAPQAVMGGANIGQRQVEMAQSWRQNIADNWATMMRDASYMKASGNDAGARMLQDAAGQYAKNIMSFGADGVPYVTPPLQKPYVHDNYAFGEQFRNIQAMRAKQGDLPELSDETNRLLDELQYYNDNNILENARNEMQEYKNERRAIDYAYENGLIDEAEWKRRLKMNSDSFEEAYRRYSLEKRAYNSMLWKLQRQPVVRSKMNDALQQKMMFDTFLNGDSESQQTPGYGDNLEDNE